METVLIPGENPVLLQAIYDLGVVDPGLDASRITRLLATGLELVQNHSAVSLLTQTRICDLNNDLTLPQSPVQSIVSVVQTNIQTGVQTTLVENTDFYVTYQTNPSRIVFLTGYWLSGPSRMQCTYVSGYSDSSLIPQPLIMGLCQYVIDNLENPSAGLTQEAYEMIMQSAIYHAY